MTFMSKPTPSPRADSPAPKDRRPWIKPALVEYGHLAKLTRGGSGGMVESMLPRACL